MIDPQTQSALQEVVRRESRSLLSYIGDAYPWATAASEPALARLRELVRAENDAVTALGEYLTRKRIGVGFLGSYPASFTSWNFISLSYLLPHLVRTEKELVAALESDLARLPAGEPKAEAEKLLAVKRRNLEALQGLAVPAASA